MILAHVISVQVGNYELRITADQNYKVCYTCKRKVPHECSGLQCINHGPQGLPNYSYCFRTTIDDGTSTSLTCFSLQAHTLTPDCNEVVNELTNKDPYQLPPALKDLEGARHMLLYKKTQLYS